MTVQEWLEKTYKSGRHNTRCRAICKDGFSVSIQGGTDYHYCEPRHDINMYRQVELGFPSELMESISNYAETENTVDTVWAYVPIEKVENVISLHGGIDYEKSIYKDNSGAK